MRFLILTQYFPPEIGASQVRLSALARELQRLGHEVEVVTALPNHPTGRIFPDYRGHFYVREGWEGVLVHRVWLYPSTGAGIKRILNYLSFAVSSLVGLYRAKRPDILFIESPPLFLGITGLLVARFWRIPAVLNVADLWPDAARDLGVLRNDQIYALAEALEAWCYRNATFVNAVTEGILSSLIQKKGVRVDKVLFLPNGVDTSLFRPREPDWELADQLGLANRKMLLYPGTIGFAHGLEVAIEAMDLLRGRAPDVTLVIVGDGSERARLKSMVHQRGLENVLFLPPQNPTYVAQLLSIALAGVVTVRDIPVNAGARPSKMFPIMASGKPVIYSGKGEGARMVEQAKSGIVVSPEDPQALANAIVYLLEHPDVASELGANGRRFVEENFSWDKLVGRWLSDLENRLGGV
ncbi:glycosyltransferase family 4 protein [Thermus sp.]|jgi:glycosyltransferase involved in cell wall biosynthesis|uniref:glycosyltransferase family 4 protein n=1 Tax=Thermus sp. TaxID=275 RepID=UPI0032201B54